MRESSSMELSHLFGSEALGRSGKSQSDMSNLGIKVISCNIQGHRENGLINAWAEQHVQDSEEAAIASGKPRGRAIKQAETSEEQMTQRSSQIKSHKKQRRL